MSSPAASSDAASPARSSARPASAGRASAPAWPRLRLAVGLGCGVALLAAMLAIEGPAQVASALRQADARFVAAALGAYAAMFALRGLRWRVLLGPGGAGAGTAALLTAAGWLVSTVVPMKAGDVMRAAWMGRRHRSGVAAAGGTVALERLLDVAGLAVACTLGLVALRLDGDAVPPQAGEAVAVAWLLPGLGLAAILALGLVLTPARRRNLALRFSGRALDQAHGLLERPALWAPVAALTALATLAQTLVYVFLLLAFLPHADPVLLLAGAPLFLLSFAVALTPGHLGTYEAAFVLVFAGLGVGADAGTLLAVALAVHLLTASMVGILGGLAFGALAAGRPSTAETLAAAPQPARPALGRADDEVPA